MLLGNPAFVPVFYRLFKDIAVAKNLLSLIIGKDIVYLELHKREQNNNSYTVTHLEFSALIREENGNEHYIAIEILKAMYFENIIRFRKKFHPPQHDIKEYCTPENSKNIAMPVLSIYFLTHCLEHIKVPLIRVDKGFIDMSTGELLNTENEDFIKGLTHDSIIIQLAALRNNSRTLLEKVLSVFEDGERRPDYVDIQEEDYPKEFNDVFERLLRIGATKQVREVLFTTHNTVEMFSIKEKELIERESRIADQNKELAELAERNKEIAQTDKKIEYAIKLIAEAEGISLEEARKMID